MYDILRWVIHWFSSVAVTTPENVDAALNDTVVTTLAASDAGVTTLTISEAIVGNLSISDASRS